MRLITIKENEAEQRLDKFLAKFDSDWARYNRDIIRMVQEGSQELFL